MLFLREDVAHTVPRFRMRVGRSEVHLGNQRVSADSAEWFAAKQLLLLSLPQQVQERQLRHDAPVELEPFALCWTLFEVSWVAGTFKLFVCHLTDSHCITETPISDKRESPTPTYVRSLE